MHAERPSGLMVFLEDLPDPLVRRRGEEQQVRIAPGVIGSQAVGDRIGDVIDAQPAAACPLAHVPGMT